MGVSDMKKWLLLKFLLLVMVGALIGCSNSTKTTEQYISVGTYVMQESEESIKPNVSLEDSNKFTFTYSVLSSYIAIGSYEVDDGSLILKTDDSEYIYVFIIKDGALVFNAKNHQKSHHLQTCPMVQSSNNHARCDSTMSYS